MAFGSIEFTTISRAQEYSAIKQNEDYKGMAEQAGISQGIQKQVQQRTKAVHQSDDTQWHRRNPDAKEKGHNEYQGDGGRRRGDRSGDSGNEQNYLKRQGGIDIKI
jgi:hypothetical protein